MSWKWSDNPNDISIPLLSIYFNRDEQLTRPLATPPQVYQAEDVTYMAPIDPLRGGTWLAVNTYNIAVTLLNNYAILPAKEKNYASRGHIVTSLMSCKNLSEIKLTLESLIAKDLYPAFSLVAFDPHSHGYLFFQWNENTLESGDLPHPFFTSSSWNTEAVQQERLESYLSEVVTNNTPHEVFHTSTPQGKELSSVYMQREKTQTVSRTYIHLYEDKATMHYFDRASDENYTATLITSTKHA